MFVIITGAGNDDHEDDAKDDGVVRLPDPGYGLAAGTVHGLIPGHHFGGVWIAACRARLHHAELWRRPPPGRRCLGCFGGQSAVAALRRS